MRPIKFRAWDVETKQFHYFDLETIGSLQREFTITRWLGMPKEQFTGLHDKNGREIYEGDILAPNNREVIFKNDGIMGEGVGFYTIAHKAPYGREPWTFGKTQAEASEVIGNIHENQELLKGAS